MFLVTRFRFSLLLLTICLLCPVQTCFSDDQVSAAERDAFFKEIELLKKLPHGWRGLDPEQQKTLDNIKTNRQHYVPIILSIVTQCRERQDTEGCLEMWKYLVLLDPKAADQLLVDTWLDLERSPEESGKSRDSEKIKKTQNNILLGIRELKDGQLALKLLEEYPKEDTINRNRIRQCLMKMTSNRGAVIERLESMVSETKSETYNDPELMKLLSKLKGSRNSGN